MKFKYNEDTDEYELENIDCSPVKLKGNNVAKQDLEGGEIYEVILHNGNEFKWYPLCKYSKIFSCPSDIKEDWLNGINETKKMLIEDGITVEIPTV